MNWTHRLTILIGFQLFNTIATGLVISNESLNPRIGWDSRMKDVFPDWKLLDSEATEKATIEDVMSHQTGLPVGLSLSFIC